MSTTNDTDKISQGDPDCPECEGCGCIECEPCIEYTFEDDGDTDPADWIAGMISARRGDL